MFRSTLLLLTAALALGACEKTATPDEAAPEAAPEATPAEQPAAEEPATAGLPDRDPKLAWRLVENDGALLLDVRTQGEWDEGHLEGATLIPHDQITERMQDVVDAVGGDKSKPVVIYCRSGGRAGKAKQALLDAGFSQVTNAGGISDWPTACDDDPGQCAE